MIRSDLHCYLIGIHEVCFSFLMTYTQLIFSSQLSHQSGYLVPLLTLLVCISGEDSISRQHRIVALFLSTIARLAHSLKPLLVYIRFPGNRLECETISKKSNYLLLKENSPFSKI